MATRSDREQNSQAEKFKRIAREVEADEDESAFDERLRRIAKQKPKQEKAPDD